MLTTDAGAMLTVKVTGPRGALFDLDVLGGLGTKHGALTGVVAEFVGGDQEYSASAGLDCLLHLKTSGTRIDVVQEGSCKNEGFSDSLSASGDYHPK
jgi:hypothetical protein